MARCDHCGNDYDRAFKVTTPEGKSYTFDSFECAIHLCAPKCEHCDCKVIGHGVQKGERIFCCASCAQMAGVKELRDRAA